MSGLDHSFPLCAAGHQFNTSQERESASWPSCCPSCGLARALLKLFTLVLFCSFLGCVCVGELPFIPSGCSGSSISSVKGSVFSRALSSLVEQPEPSRRQCYSSGETGKKRRGRGSRCLSHHKGGAAPSGGGAIVALRPVSCMTSSSALLPGRELLKSDCAIFTEPRGTF